MRTVGCDTNCGRKASINVLGSIVNRQCDGDENELTPDTGTLSNKLMHRVTSKGNSADISSRALEIKLPQSTKRVTGKTGHGVSRHKNNNKVDNVH